MAQQPRSLIVPVENQVRELDPKLLVACAAAERGFRVFLGSRTRIDFRIASFPRGFYLAKGMTPKSAKMFRIMRRIGHEIAALDEEGLVYHSASEYYARRVSEETLQLVTTLFAWGDAGAELLRDHRGDSAAPVRVTGNPRIDLLRPELRGYFAEDAARIRARHGPFLLINTNFSKVNAYFPKMNLLVPSTRPDQPAELGAAGIGLPRDFAEGLASHKSALFDHFRAMIPVLHSAFPGHRLIVRPHPSENRAPWQAVVSDLERADVIHEGNVIAWLEASSALIHNGCTTGIEAFCLGKPAIAYRPVSRDPFDLELPNSLSRQCFDLDTLSETIASVLDEEVRRPPERGSATPDRTPHHRAHRRVGGRPDRRRARGTRGQRCTTPARDPAAARPVRCYHAQPREAPHQGAHPTAPQQPGLPTKPLPGCVGAGTGRANRAPRRLPEPLRGATGEAVRRAHPRDPGRPPSREFPCLAISFEHSNPSAGDGIEPLLAQRSRATSAIFAATTQVRGWRPHLSGPNHDVSLR